MAERKFRMLLKNGKGRPLPWTELLSVRPDMQEAMMTAEEITGVKPLRSGLAAARKVLAEKNAETTLMPAPEAFVQGLDESIVEEVASPDIAEELKKNESITVTEAKLNAGSPPTM